jgi:hypothetical protein
MRPSQMWRNGWLTSLNVSDAHQRDMSITDKPFPASYADSDFRSIGEYCDAKHFNISIRDLDADEREHVARYQQARKNLNDEFRGLLKWSYGLRDNPKEPLLFDIAWEYGHSSGYAEVEGYYRRLAELIA